MHNIHVRARKDPTKEWTKLPFIAIDDAIFTVLEKWPLEWRALDLEGMERVATQQRKKDTKLHIVQLAEKRCQEKAAVEATT